MTYTAHGHHISGTATEEAPEAVMRCGGPERCGACSKDAVRAYMYRGEYEKEVIIGDNTADYQVKAKQIVQKFVSALWSTTDKTPPKHDLYVVWFTKTLGNWKALVGTTLDDGMYYEVTYNGEKKETYLDAYMKVDNLVILD